MARTKRTEKNYIQKKPLSWKVAIYIRLSKDDGNEVSLSVKNQKQRLLKYVEENPDFELYDIYIDDGYTGTDSERDNFQRMLQDVNDKKINCVVVKDPSRLSRNYIEAGNYMENLFVKLDVRFISLELPSLDSYKNPEQMNSIIVPIQNVINDDFCRQTSIKVRGVFNMKRSQGQFIGAFAPYGYMKDPKDKSRFIIDEEAAEIVRDIFKMFVDEGMSKIGITKRLNELGIVNPSTYKQQKGFNYSNPHNTNLVHKELWSSRTITTILKNQMYIGDMVQGKYRVKSYKVHDMINTPEEEWFIVKDTHEPIIDLETFNKAQKLQEKDTRTAPNSRKNYLFSGLLYCADCNQAMVRNKVNNHVYYNCRTYREQSKTACTKHTIRHDVLEKAVLETIQSQIKLATSMSDIINQINQSSSKKNKSKRLDNLEQTQASELKKLNNILDNVYFDWKNEEITIDQYRRIKDKTIEQIEHIKETLKTIKKEQEVLKNGIDSKNVYLETFLKYKNISSLERKTLVDLVDRIIIHEGGEITIRFNFLDQHKLILDYIESNSEKNAKGKQLTRLNKQD